MSKIYIVLCIIFLSLGSLEAVAKTKIIKHRINKGETFYSLSRRYHTTVQKIRRVNHFKKSTILYSGQVIKVPKKVKRKKETRKRSKIKKRKNRKRYAKKYKKYKNKKRRISKTKKYYSKKRRQNRIISLAKTKLGRRYVYGSSGRRNAYDCSGLTSYVYKKVGITLPRTARKQSRFGKYIRRSKLRKGDLLFFDTGKPRRGYVNHVAIYLGNNKFIHASSIHKKVIYGHFNTFYKKRYKGARRPS